MAALKEVEAPVLTNGSSAESIFRRADANLSGAVDFDECDPALPSFMPPDVLLMLFFEGSCARLSYPTSWRWFWTTTTCE
jgi:hypothetical protein